MPRSRPGETELFFSLYQIHEADNSYCRWTALNTATLKFSEIYNAIKRNPPSGFLPDKLMATTQTVYANQTRGTAFHSISAWQRVCHAPKWRGNRADLTTPVLSSDQTDNDHPSNHAPSTLTIIGICTPSSRLALLIARPMGQKASKKH
jgi:hypothetical protein